MLYLDLKQINYRIAKSCCLSLIASEKWHYISKLFIDATYKGLLLNEHEHLPSSDFQY